MDDFPIHANARATGKPSVSEEGGTGTAFFDVSANQSIQLLRADARADGLLCDEERLTRDPSRFPHDTKLFGIFQ